MQKSQVGLRIVTEKSENMSKILCHRRGMQNFRCSGRCVDYIFNSGA